MNAQKYLHDWQQLNFPAQWLPQTHNQYTKNHTWIEKHIMGNYQSWMTSSQRIEEKAANIHIKALNVLLESWRTILKTIGGHTKIGY